IGTIVAALVMAPVLNLLLDAYGIGPATSQHPNSLAAPQSTLMAAVSKGVFEGGLPWAMIIIGMVIAVIIILIDINLEKREASFRAPVLAVAIGIYLPFELGVPIFAGGLLSAFVKRKINKTKSSVDESKMTSIKQRGMLIASGLI